MNKESEKALEARLVSEVKKRGGQAIKLTSQFHRGLPDRLVVLPYHTILFVEMKSTGEKPTPLQLAAHEKLREMRFTVRVIDSTESLDEMLAGIDARLARETETDARRMEERREAIAEAKARVKAKQKMEVAAGRARRRIMEDFKG